jgi:hypothetical protein
MNLSAMKAELAASLPRILLGRDPIAFTPPEFYRDRVRRFSMTLADKQAATTDEKRTAE